jgi:hypothetical protein
MRNNSKFADNHRKNTSMNNNVNLDLQNIYCEHYGFQNYYSE